MEASQTEYLYLLQICMLMLCGGPWVIGRQGKAQVDEISDPMKETAENLLLLSPQNSESVAADEPRSGGHQTSNPLVLSCMSQLPKTVPNTWLSFVCHSAHWGLLEQSQRLRWTCDLGNSLPCMLYWKQEKQMQSVVLVLFKIMAFEAEN